MNAKTMEGLVGANSNINLINTPMRIYKDARRRGDTAMMERAMGYVTEFEGRAQEYKGKADEGMEEEARAEREKAEAEREEAVQRRKAEREEWEERIADSKEERADTDPKETEACVLEISEEGKALACADVISSRVCRAEIYGREPQTAGAEKLEIGKAKGE